MQAVQTAKLQDSEEPNLRHRYLGEHWGTTQFHTAAKAFEMSPPDTATIRKPRGDRLGVP